MTCRLVSEQRSTILTVIHNPLRPPLSHTPLIQIIHPSTHPSFHPSVHPSTPMPSPSKNFSLIRKKHAMYHMSRFLSESKYPWLVRALHMIPGGSAGKNKFKFSLFLTLLPMYNFIYVANNKYRHNYPNNLGEPPKFSISVGDTYISTCCYTYLYSTFGHQLIKYF